MQAEISARVMRLAEELMREASRELETILLKRVCDQLRVRACPRSWKMRCASISARRPEQARRSLIDG